MSEIELIVEEVWLFVSGCGLIMAELELVVAESSLVVEEVPLSRMIEVAGEVLGLMGKGVGEFVKEDEGFEGVGEGMEVSVIAEELVVDVSVASVFVVV